MQRNTNNLLLSIGFTLLAWSGFIAASDIEKENRWSQQFVDDLVVGESCQLKAGTTEFTGIFTEASAGPTGRAVILAHGIGVHPDWPEIINPLRSELPEHGWSTLSIQMPILANDAPLKDYLPLFDEAGPRIEAAVKFLRDQGNNTIVLIGHSLGAAMAASYLANNTQHGLQGLVIIGLGVIDLDDRMNGVLALEKIQIPVLDLYGSRDLETVLDSVKTRAMAARKAGNKSYRQTEIEGADHFFIGMEDTLNRRVYGWLQSRYNNKPR
jgi:pimeloyl-ACP methyl ester carboxylesterase